MCTIQAGNAIKEFAELATKYDKDGIDVHFLNSRFEGLGLKVSLGYVFSGFIFVLTI